MAHIRKLHTGRYQVRYRDPGGRERARHFRRRTDAERFLHSVETDKIRGEWTDPRLGRTTFQDWASRFVETRVHLRPSTRALDETLMRNHILPYFGPRPLNSVTPTDVQGLIAEMEMKGLSASTVRHAYALAGAAFRSAVESSLLARSPCRGIQLPQLTRREMRVLAPDEISSLADTIERRYRALVLTAAYAGLRFGQATGLFVTDLDLLRRSLTVRRTLNEVKGKLHLAEPKTVASRRQLACPAFLCDELAAHLAEWPTGENGFVFTSPEGGAVRRSHFRRRVWRPAVRASVGEPLRFHDLRHSHAALLIANGEHPKVIQSRLGHADIRTTLNMYGHLFEGLDEAAADRLDETFRRTPADYPRTAGSVTDIFGNS